MKVVITRKGEYSICGVEGEINLNTSPELRKAFEELSQGKSRKVVIDFAEVPYIDSSGLATLIELFQRLKKNNGALRICCVSDKVKNIFEITKLHRLFEVYSDQESALENF
jgi:anti-sigma B factor antagonist